MVDTLVRDNCSILFTVGGDGTLKGAHSLAIGERDICFASQYLATNQAGRAEVERRGLKIAIVGVPKTIDNDIPLMEKTFGFTTAVARAVDAIKSGHCEAFSQPNGSLKLVSFCC